MKGTQVSWLKQSTSQLHHVVKDGKILSRSRRVISVTHSWSKLSRKSINRLAIGMRQLSQANGRPVVVKLTSGYKLRYVYSLANFLRTFTGAFRKMARGNEPFS